MCRLQTPQLEEALKGYPLYSQDGKGKDAICRAIFTLGNVRWFILEGETDGNDTTLFGIVIGLMEDEYGYISLNELSDVEIDLTSKGLGKLKVQQLQELSFNVYYEFALDRIPQITTLEKINFDIRDFVVDSRFFSIS